MTSPRRSLAALAALASAALVGASLAPAHAAVPTSRTYEDLQSDSRHYAPASVPAVYRDLGEVYRVRVFSAASRLKVEFGFRSFLDDRHTHHVTNATFFVGSSYYVATLSTDEPATLKVRNADGTSYTEVCPGSAKKSYKVDYDLGTFSVPISCVTGGHNLTMVTGGTTVFYRSGTSGRYDSIADDPLPDLRSSGKVKLR